MSIVLFLLKWIGILLLILLGLVLFLLVLVLFVPVRYEGSFEKQETMSGFAKVTWFFRAFELTFSMEKETVIKVRVLFWNLYDSRKEEKEMQTKPVLLEAREKKEPVKKKKEAPKPKEKPKEPVKQETPPEVHLKKEEKQEKPQEFRKVKVSEVKETPPKQLEEKKEFEMKQAQVKRIKMKETVETEEIEKEEEEKKEEKLDFEYLKNMPNKKDTIKIGIKFIKRVLKQVFPRWIEIKGEIGTGEPALTGQALALAGICSAVLHIYAHVKGNFEKQMIQGAVKAKGSIFLGGLCYSSLCFIFAKPIWKMIKLYLKG